MGCTGNPSKRSATPLSWHHATVFVITFLLYSLYHACRKSFSNIKDLFVKSHTPETAIYPYDVWQKHRMFEDVNDANVFLGELDFLLLIAYGMGMFLSGMLGERINIRYVLSFGIIGSSIATYLSCSLSVNLNIQSKIYFRILFFVNGLFQSTGWPCVIAVMGNWFSKETAGLVFGIWGINAYLGNVLGSLLITSVLDYGYENGILLVSMASFCFGVVVFFGLIPHPGDIDVPSPDETDDDEWLDTSTSLTISMCGSQNVQQQRGDGVGECPYQRKDYDGKLDDILQSGVEKGPCEEEEPLVADVRDGNGGGRNAGGGKAPISFLKALQIPGVLPYSAAFACFKLITYAFFFWLPTYLAQGLHWNDKDSNIISNSFEVGLVIGSVVSGVLSDFIGYRAPVNSSMLLLTMVSVYLYKTLGKTYISNVVLMICTGFFIGGPENMMTSVIAADLGKHKDIVKGTSALATVSGIINGSGSVGSAFGQLAVGYICKVAGWIWVFYFLLIMSGVSFLLLLPVLLKELRECCYRNKKDATA